MCLVVIAFGVDAGYPLVVAGNRDEFHARPTRDAGWWPDEPDILGGRDLQAGGTWLGLHRAGRFATVTNFRDADKPTAKFRSRGELVSNFLTSPLRPVEYLGTIDTDNYAGFNLLVADTNSLAYLSNRGGGLRELPAGIYGLSNATLDTPWEKVERSKSRLSRLIASGRNNETELMRILDDRHKGPASEVKSDRLPFAMAHAITAPFIVLPDYGTRCSTVVRATADGSWTLLERRFDPAGKRSGESSYAFAS